MSYLNANIPPIYCKIRREYLYDLREHKGEVEDCVVFAIASIPGRAILFHALLTNGAIYWRLPISAFLQGRNSGTVHQGEMESPDLEDLELWNSFSYYPAITTFDFLIGQRCKYLGKDKKFIHGEYLFTIDWAHPEPNILDTEHSEIPDQHKCAHVFWLLITVIMQLSLIIVFCGTLVVLLLLNIGQIIKLQLQNGMLKIKTGN
jgi:hypothetical protein